MGKGKDINIQNNGNGYHIIEVLLEADSLLRKELRNQLIEENSSEIQFLLEAQLNVSKAMEALLDRSLYKHDD